MLLYFILGILFVELVVPILDVLTTMMATKAEVFKYKWSVKVAEYNAQIQKLAVDEEPHNAIGFVIPNDNYDEEEDDE